MNLSLWLCADMSALPANELVSRVARALEGGPACVWLRPSVEIPSRAVRDCASALRAAAQTAGGALVVGDRIDVALSVGADGVHLSGHSISPSDARALLDARHSRAWISAAVHDEGGVRAAGSIANVLVLSPFASVPGKGPALGPGAFARLVSHCPARPFIALGGILDADTAVQAARAGASAIAVRRALLESEDPLDACASLHAAFVFARARRGRDDRVPVPGENSPPIASPRATMRPPA